LLHNPSWSTPAAQYDLPPTVPGWVVAFLALQPDWISRDRVAALFWPDAGNDEALNNLRVNLHRTKQLLEAWGIDSALQAERRRVRLALPTDVAQLRQALAEGQSNVALELYQRPLLDGMGFPGFPALQEWFELERAELHAAWREALLRRMQTTDTTPAHVLVVTQRLLAMDALDEEAMTRQIDAFVRSGRAADAQRAYAAYCKRLADELNAAPSLTLQQLAAKLPQRGAATGWLPAAPAPAHDGFIGRQVELDQLRAMLEQPHSRCVTLLGPGGVGKSRTARELSRQLSPQHRDGACWVALADCRDVDGALVRLAAAIGVTLSAAGSHTEQLRRALAPSQRLVILDNAEQVSGLGEWLADQIDAAPRVRWVVTSRVALAMPHERLFALEGLTHPAADEPVATADQARAHDAVCLLESRVRALRPDFDLASQLQACVALVRRVGGWPLALEIAASALAVQPAVEVLADLDQSLDTLAAGEAPQHSRHDSVRASLQLSWQLLAPEQRRALAALSVFRGSFTRSAALAVTLAAGPALAALIERLLVHATGGSRWALHPLVAQFAGERLGADTRTESDARQRHAEHFLQRLGALGDRNQTDAPVANAVEEDFENFRESWQWAIEQQRTAALGAAASAWTRFCNAKGRARDVVALIGPALAASQGNAAARASLLLALGNARYRAGGFDDAVALAEQAAAAADAAGDAVGGRSALNLLALSLVQRGRIDEAERHAQVALARARVDGLDGEAAQIANTCAIVAKTRGDFAAAASLYEEAIVSHRQRGNMRSLASALNNLGNVWRAREDLREAQRCFEECLRVCEQHGIASTRAFALGNLGLVAYQGGRLDAARQFADRTLAEPAAEPAMIMAAHSLQARVAVNQRRLEDAAPSVRQVAELARAAGLHMAMLEAINCHALLLAALGRRRDAAARLTFVVQHPLVAAMARSSAAEAIDALRLSEDERGTAQRAAKGLDLDVLLDEAARAAAGS